MKMAEHFKLLIVTCILPILTWAQNSSPKFCETVVPDQSIYDFGTILEEKGKVNHVFTLTNKSKKPVSITKINAWCGCTTADYTHHAIALGKTGTVKVNFNPNHRPGKFSKEVVVMLNNGKAYIRLWVKGNVKGYQHPVKEECPYYLGEGLYMSPTTMAFPYLRKSKSYTFQLLVANDSDKPITVKLNRVPDNRVLKMPEMLKLKALERTSITVSYTAPRSYSYRRHIEIRPSVNGKEVKPLRVTWSGSQTEASLLITK
jgi:hypothetical protein